MQETFPECYKEFVRIAELLEKHYKDVQDMEFTVERNKLYMLQTRNGKRTAQAAVKIAVDMVSEGLIDKKTAITRLDPDQIEQLLHPTFDADELAASAPVATGLAASPGAACGRVFFTAQAAAGTKDASCERGNITRGFGRHGSCRRNFDSKGRHDLPRSGSCKRHGQVLRCRLLRNPRQRGREKNIYA